MKAIIQLTVNGEPVEELVPTNMTLLDLLRDRLALTGTKHGCGAGDCGACTVLLDGVPVNACLVLAAETEGHDVLTIEGLAEGETLHPIQQAFVDAGGVQCGFCTPGMILTAKHLLDHDPDPSPETIREAIAGNLCRCTGYQKIVESIQHAARSMQAAGRSS